MTGVLACISRLVAGGTMRSFDTDPASVVSASRGQRVHRDSLAHSDNLVRNLYEVRTGVWSLVGNGLSNQTFIDAPDGIIAIDTGESNEEMRSALSELRKVTNRPIVAVIYTHFHYVAGTREIFLEAGKGLPVYGHEKIDFNRSRAATEIGPSYGRGLVYQFGIALPPDGPDGLVNVGLGLHYRNRDHHPFTNGYVPPTIEWRGGEKVTIAGLKVEVTHAPSDADDSVTLWFPEIKTCVHNIVWPVLFNIFAIRGEEYRDPLQLVRGIDHVMSLGAEYLVAAHGPPMIGAVEIQERVMRDRDSIQFLWDQTVRGMNKGMTMDEIASTVSLPSEFDNDFLTSELYGVAEHHVRQIYSGIRGWFDGDPSKLFPLEPQERASRLVAGFGGTKEVARQAEEAVKNNDLRWALELSSWLVAQSTATSSDRQRLAGVLREIGYRSAAANIRNWCLTTARDLDGTDDLSRFCSHRLREAQVLAMSPKESLNLLRVMLDPLLAEGIDCHIGFDLSPTESHGLHVRRCVAVVTDGTIATNRIQTSFQTWASILAGSIALSDSIATGSTLVSGNSSEVLEAMAVFENSGLRR